MKRLVPFLSVLAGLSLAAAPPVEKPKPPPPDPVQVAFDKLVHADKDWQAAAAASRELAALGQKAVQRVTEEAEDHCDARVRLACYKLLTDAFAKDGWAIEAVIRSGLHDKDPAIRYHCAFLLGDLKIYHSYRALQAVLKDLTGKDDQHLRFTVAKSLAQLGEADVLPILFAAVTDDGFMARHMGNIGLKALSGKNLGDFERYNIGEGATVSGGAEYVTAFDAITTAEKKAKRFQAATAYFKWLKAERPELYKHVTYY